MRLQHWITRLARQNKAKTTRATGQQAWEVADQIYNALAKLYTPLDQEKQEIRLLLLSPGEYEDDLACEIQTVSLLEEVSYEALSYAWGVARPVRKIFIDGHRYQISGNLESALRHLRYADKTRALWADAICINQTDIAERNSQVKYMGTTYQKATQVLVWLGPEYDDSDLAFEFLNAMPSDVSSHWDPGEQPSLAAVMTRPHVDAVNALFDRAWWQRVWTVQESVLGLTLRFVCGRCDVLAEQAFAVGKGYFRHVYACCQPIWHSTLDPRAGLGDSCDALLKLEGMRLHRHEYTFPQILSMFMFRNSSDPHDKVYGLLGLASEEEAALVTVDYSSSVAELYQEVAFKFLEKSGELGFLSLQFPKTMEEDGVSPKGLPTWVPNWALAVHSTLLYDLDDRFSCLPMFSASGQTKAAVKKSSTGGLFVKGSFLTKVETLSPNIHHWDAADNLAAFFNTWRDIVGITNYPDRLYVKSQTTTYSDAFWQTLCCSVIPDRVHPRDVKLAHRTSDTSPHKLWYDAWWLWCEEHNCEGPRLPLIKSSYSEAEINSMGGLISTAISLRRLFVAEDGRMGLVPMDAQVGDTVALLEGGRVPYILRRSQHGGHFTYELVGDAYVHGIMDGEEWTGQGLTSIVLV
ncbi:ankyrin and HET domain-containing protein [Colletotrichum tofieldiae]|uniref:Ankyrin and HET domain-containing protein n=1 Tax=Colletotrichum tofieldiae TaxID=708197 RepID=A0A166Y8C5_9PEZI|nr:ankyrin and HET domain-containing protein [Colletotrichum tofieldiae]GKT79780.1 ankyrin and HET domain-containing protein [Colletotrichum tofieldiae]